MIDKTFAPCEVVISDKCALVLRTCISIAKNGFYNAELGLHEGI